MPHSLDFESTFLALGPMPVRHALLENGLGWVATLNVAASVLLGLLAVRAGLVTGKAWFS